MIKRLADRVPPWALCSVEWSSPRSLTVPLDLIIYPGPTLSGLRSVATVVVSWPLATLNVHTWSCSMFVCVFVMSSQLGAVALKPMACSTLPDVNVPETKNV